jgi:hypothetical protein
VADVFTKGLPTARFHFLKLKLKVLPSLISLRGDVKHTDDIASTHAASITHASDLPAQHLANIAAIKSGAISIIPERI